MLLHSLTPFMSSYDSPNGWTIIAAVCTVGVAVSSDIVPMAMFAVLGLMSVAASLYHIPSFPWGETYDDYDDELEQPA